MIHPQDIKTWLSAGQVAKEYQIARNSVFVACKTGRFSEEEAIETQLGWLISPIGAERVFKYRLK